MFGANNWSAEVGAQSPTDCREAIGRPSARPSIFPHALKVRMRELAGAVRRALHVLDDETFRVLALRALEDQEIESRLIRLNTR